MISLSIQIYKKLKRKLNIHARNKQKKIFYKMLQKMFKNNSNKLIKSIMKLHYNLKIIILKYL